MQNLEVPDRYKPVLKAHLFLHKLRKINTIDRQIRHKWQKLQKQKTKQQLTNEKSLLDIHKLSQLKQNEIQRQIIKHQMSPNRIARIRSDIIREQTHLRKKKYDQIYFKKQKRNFSPIRICPVYKHSSNDRVEQKQKTLRTKTEGDQSPLIYRKRKKRMQKQLSIIKNRYQNGLRTISQKKLFENEKIVDNHKCMLRKLKGSKFYFQLTSSLEPIYLEH